MQGLIEMKKKIRTTLYISRDVVEKAKELGFNISKTLRKLSQKRYRQIKNYQ